MSPGPQVDGPEVTPPKSVSGVSPVIRSTVLPLLTITCGPPSAPVTLGSSDLKTVTSGRVGAIEGVPLTPLPGDPFGPVDTTTTGFSPGGGSPPGVSAGPLGPRVVGGVAGGPVPWPSVPRTSVSAESLPRSWPDRFCSPSLLVTAHRCRGRRSGHPFNAAAAETIWTTTTTPSAAICHERTGRRPSAAARRVRPRSGVAIGSGRRQGAVEVGGR